MIKERHITGAAMHIYAADQKKRNRFLKNVIRNNVSKAKPFVKFCYWLTLFLRIAAVILGIATVLYVIIGRIYPFYLFFLILTCLFPFAFSYLPATVYIVSCGNDYRLRKGETVSSSDGGFLYAFHDDRSHTADKMYCFHVLFNSIDQFLWDGSTGCITLFGSFPTDIYENGVLIDTEVYSQLSLLDTYKISLKTLLEKNVNTKV